MPRKLLVFAFLLTLVLTVIATQHQLTNAAANVAPPPQHAPAIGPTPTPSWHVISGGGGKDVYLADVSMSSATDGWAVGVSGPSSYGVLMHYDGSTWSQTSVPTGTYSIRAVQMISSTDGWAVGSNACSSSCGTLLMHYTNGDWQKVTVPPPGNQTGYSDVDIKGSAGWAIGYGWALQFDGANWTPVDIPFGYNDVSVVDGNNAWAVGTSRNALGYSNGNWLPVSLGLSSLPLTLTVRMQSIHMLDATEGWAAGFATYGSSGSQCLLVHRSNGPWTRVPCPVENLRLYAIRMRSATDVWAVGLVYPSQNPVSLHYDGTNWTMAPLPVSISSIELVGANDGWMAGAHGSILHLTSGAWTRVQGSSFPIGPSHAPSISTRPIDATDANTVWWYGDSPGQLYRWSNGTVTTHTSPITRELYALDMVSSTVGWAGTATGWMDNTSDYLLRYSGGTWMTWPMTDAVYALSMLGPDEGWIASGYGATPILHYLDGTFTPESLPAFYVDNITSLSMLDSQHGWAAGFNHGVYSYTAGIWVAVTPTLKVQNANMRIIGISPDDAWVAGYSTVCDVSGCPATPELHHFAGGLWTNIISPTNQLSGDWLAFFDISKVSATEWWAAGKLETMEYAFLHYKDGTYTTVPAAGEAVMAVSMLPDGSGFASGVGSLLWLHSYPYNVYLPLTKR